MLWNFTSDDLVFGISDVAQLANKLELTKRNAVSLAPKFYDPLRFVSPITVQLKILFQSLCKAGVEWDESLNGDLLDQWKLLVSGLLKAETITIRRCYLDGIIAPVVKYSLQGFCDASSLAYGAVLYLKIDMDDGSHVRLLTAKTRVSPVQTQTIPRLELLGALLLAKLVVNVTSALKSEIIQTCYTDSRVALYWIKGFNRDWKQFVQNRATEIRRLVPVDCWRHCPGKENPANIPLREILPDELKYNSLWWNGPQWLTKLRKVSKDIDETTIPGECLSEMKKPQESLNLLVTERSVRLDRIIDCEKFSSYIRLIHVTSYVLKFARLLKMKTRGNSETVNDLLEAERYWLRESQFSLMSNERYSAWKQLFTDRSGLLKCQGSLANADIPYETRYPVLLSPTHHLTTLIVKECPKQVKHNGVKETLTQPEI